MEVGILLDRKSLIAVITKYHDYKRFIHTASLKDVEEQLSKLPRYGVQRAVLETEINFYGYIAKVESIAVKLTEDDAETFMRILSINTTRRLSAAEMAKEIGTSLYKFQNYLDKVLIEINKKM